MSVRWIPGGGSGGAVGANPSASVGLTVVNGVATTFMRSDAAPALDVTITPTWTGLHTFQPVMVANTPNDAQKFATNVAASAGNQINSPGLEFQGNGWATTGSASQAVNIRQYLRPVQGATNPTALWIVDWSVNGGAFADILQAGISANGTFTWLGSATFNNCRVQGATIPTNGIYMPTSNQLGFSTNGSQKATIETGGQIRQIIVGAGYSVAEGTNAKMGVTGAMTAGSITVSTTAVTANSRIFLTAQTVAGTAGALAVSARTAGTSFTITSSSGTDTSTVAWIIFEPS